MQLFVDGNRIKTQYQTEIGEDILVSQQKQSTHLLDILMENM
ncbi:Glycosyl hydrolase family 35, partial [human gut metagenome]